MANTIVQLELPEGLTATLSLYADGSDTLANSGGADTLTEATNRKGLYTATVTEALSGLHFAKVLVGANLVASGWVNLADDTETYTVVAGYLSAKYLNQAISNLGTGPNTITITIDDGTTALQNASVRLTEGANTYTATTNASGEVTFNLPSATYTVAVSKSGYTFTGTTLVVSADATPTYSMTALSITASSAGRTTGYYDEVLDEAGNDEAGVVFSLQCTAVPTGSGLALDTKIYTQTSVVPAGADPPIEYTGLIRGAKYAISRSNGLRVEFTAPDAASFALPSVKGAE